MPRVYAIAEFLTLEQKHRACAERYTPDATGGSPRTAAGLHPLQVALGVTCKVGAHEAAAALASGSKQYYNVVFVAACIFIDHWDDGLLLPDDLSLALGLEESVPAVPTSTTEVSLHLSRAEAIWLQRSLEQSAPSPIRSRLLEACRALTT